ncbi:MAG: outer membrane lipoprotein-sorting protein [Proteobacteria bacterium]|nr:MAG: outer membrane lipoprotein-sorting protein [Pseudomonadota bacterium]
MSVSSSWAQSGAEIMTKNEEVRKVEDYSTTADLTTERKGESPRKKQFKFWRKIRSGSIRYRTLTLFQEPAEIKGQAILFLENDAGANDISLYLPAYKKVRRVESSQQSGSFMGSDFSYTDITEKHVADYQYDLDREEACGADQKCFVVRGVPKSDSVRERTGYSKFLIWIDQANHMAVRSDYWDLGGEAIKRITVSETQPVKGLAGRFFSHHIVVEQLKTGSKTTLHFSDLKIPSGTDEAFYNVNQLSKAK